MNQSNLHEAPKSARLACIVRCAMAVSALAFAQSNEAQPPTSPPPEAPTNVLALDAELLARRHRELEALLSRMAEQLANSDPDRSALLKRVFVRSRQDLLEQKYAHLVEMLKAVNLSSSLQEQETLIAELRILLEILQSEDRARLLRERRERLEKALREAAELQKKQRELRTDTERSATPSRVKDLSPSQAKLAQRAKSLEKSLGKEPSGAPPESSSPSRSPSSPRKESKDGPPGESAKGTPKAVESADKMPDPGELGQENVEKARRAMDNARQLMDDEKAARAAKEQDLAIRELRKAVEKLEELIRQLREEERQQTLASLVSRCRKMLQWQRAILESSAKLAAIDVARRQREDEQLAKSLAPKQTEVALEAERALAILKEDGTAVAFPEVFEQVRSDSRRAAERLARAAVDDLTISIERDIVTALEEMMESLEQRIADARAQAAEGGGGGSPGQGALVDQLAELKLIRTLQRRVNQRTEQLVARSNSARESDHDDMLLELARRQQRIYEATKDLATNKSKQ